MIKNFRFSVVWRVGLLFGTMLLWVFLFMQTEYYVSIAMLGMVIIFQTVQLIRYVEKTNDKLTRFLESIRYSDFSRSFPDHGLGKSFEELNQEFSRVIEEFKKERAEKQENYRYLQTVVQHIGIGLICFNREGEVELINTAAKRLFDIATLRNIRALGDIDEKLLRAVTGLKGGNRTLVRIGLGNETLQLAIYATEFRMHGDMFKLVSFQNIHTELEEKEMEAWQNLTQVLAHEIMNSITPIASLSDTVHMLLTKNTTPRNGQYVIEQEALNDVKDALSTINKRSHGLMRFVNSYRDFTQIPEPDFELFSVAELLKRVRHLNKGEAEVQQVTIDLEVDPESLEVTADPQLIEQTLINLIKNAFRALESTNNALITLRGKLDSDGHVLIQVQDNGPGIKEDNLEKIFIPFYSTSNPSGRGGSGIGLSLSRQIMRMHRGTLTVQSGRNEGTTFTLRF
ncbi:ATP-binding protein [Aliifodinibius sp. S!AR15-10]|uniref:sensor histidine kinase n=1 Tax=Aliifodinibius sp. S!AR15-10 TaxID=2950437 RepID=UPI002863F440|nr:ATP-binding protein [Aliifodinibius sp. S!AR15-10]MDR8393455.1 ATP-binding protein [Aliifodinibius sp. S!AR15-10]